VARSYLTITRDLTRVMARLKVIYRSWAIPCAGQQVYAPRNRAEWLAKISENGVQKPQSLPTLGRLESTANIFAPSSRRGSVSLDFPLS